MCTPLDTRRQIDANISVCDEHSRAWWGCDRTHPDQWGQVVNVGGGARDEADARARLADHNVRYHTGTATSVIEVSSGNLVDLRRALDVAIGATTEPNDYQRWGYLRDVVTATIRTRRAK
jgi:hypothetical protein